MSVIVRVENFQSIESAEVLVDGFTAITGQNNSGKTALMRAIQGVFSNPPADNLVRHGADKLSVSLTFSDGQTVVWEKGPKVKPTYTVNGKVIYPGRGVPDEVLALGVQPIIAGGVPIWPQIAPQFSGQIFLLDQPGSTVAEVVADVEHVGKYTAALRLAESDKRQAASDLRLRVEDVRVEEQRLSAFVGLDDAVDAYARAELTWSRVGKQAVELNRRRALADRLRANGEAVARLLWVRSAPAIDQRTVNRASSGYLLLSKASNLQHRMRVSGGVIGALVGIRSVPVRLPDTRALQQALDKLSLLEQLKQRLSSSKGRVGRLLPLRSASVSDAPPDHDALRAQYNRLLALVRLRKRLIEALAVVGSARDELRRETSELGRLRAEVDAYEVCPTCGAATRTGACS